MRFTSLLTILLAYLILMPVGSQARWWPFGGDRWRTTEQAEDYQFNVYAKRVEWIKQYEKAEEDRLVREVAAATPTPAPPPAIDPARLVIPELRPYLEEALTSPKALLPKERLARKYIKLRRYDLAREELQAGIALLPDWRAGRLLMAQIHWRQGELDLARREYNLLVVGEPEWIAPRFYRAHLLEIMARTGDALDDWEMLAQLAQQRGLLEMSALADQRIQALRGQ